MTEEQQIEQLKKDREKIENSEFARELKVFYENEQKIIEVRHLFNDRIISVLNFLRSNFLLISRIRFKRSVSFTEKVFEEDVDFSRCVFDELFYLKDCTFNCNVNFKPSWFNSRTFFHTIKFNQSVCFDGAKFHSKTIFHKSTFNNLVSFRNTSFKSLVDFYYATFCKPVQFHLTDFFDRAIFSNVIFEREVQFLHNRVDNNTLISFESAIFKSGLDISRSNFWCKLQFWNSTLKFNIKDYNLYETDSAILDLSLHKPKNLTTLQRLRETSRIIKNEYSKEGNRIQELEFKKREIELYQQELNFQNMNVKTEEKISLWFNGVSNKHGDSWVRGVGFTLIAGLIFYILFLTPLFINGDLECDPSWDGLGNVIRYYFEFINVTNWSYNPFGITNYNWSYVALFIGRIFIGYGYYQTIQAFRKFGK